MLWKLVRVRDTISKKISDNRNANNGWFGSAVRFVVEEDDEEFWKKLCVQFMLKRLLIHMED